MPATRFWNKRNKRRSVSSLLIVVMLLSMLPTGVLAVEPPSPIDLGAITGTVTDGVNGVAGALVEVVRKDIYEGWLSSGETLENGSFTLTNIPPGSFDLRISPPVGERYLLVTEVSGVNVESGVTTALDTIELLIGGAITGKVTDGVYGASIEVVRQDIYGGWLSAGETMTTEDGSFTFTNIPPGAYGLLISPPQGELHLQFAEFFVVNVASGVTTALAPIELLIGGAITGTVTDGVNGVDGALVEVVWRDIYGPWWYAGDVRTRDGGSFTAYANLIVSQYDRL